MSMIKKNLFFVSLLLFFFVLVFISFSFYSEKEVSAEKPINPIPSALLPLKEEQIQQASQELKDDFTKINQLQSEIVVVYEKGLEQARQHTEGPAGQHDLDGKTLRKINDMKIRLEHLKRLEEQL
ncbi:hypothetical protein [Thiomicrorhabdus sp.]|uniref:hypothetical protein n=1 Tax=Thiomicrorhabdus sp. TaxID=2039724 RepID=UPI0029C60242|nr:hypothetical protein [Thiomicrorhabdus sp.]